MNTPPDEAALALWLDDELTGEKHDAMEAWAAMNPDQLAARDEVRHWRTSVATVMPACVEPPYPDFFNSRVMQGIRESTPAARATPAVKPSIWQAWLMPLAACAGMAFAFWIGAKSAHPQQLEVVHVPRAIPVEPVVYTPENGVNAEWFASSHASATVIVLSGVAAIPDSTDFSETVIHSSMREIDSTASTGTTE
jgi:hypothetical protein